MIFCIIKLSSNNVMFLPDSGTIMFANKSLQPHNMVFCSGLTLPRFWCCQQKCLAQSQEILPSPIEFQNLCTIYKTYSTNITLESIKFLDELLSFHFIVLHMWTKIRYKVRLTSRSSILECSFSSSLFM